MLHALYGNVLRIQKRDEEERDDDALTPGFKKQKQSTRNGGSASRMTTTGTGPDLSRQKKYLEMETTRDSNPHPSNRDPIRIRSSDRIRIGYGLALGWIRSERVYVRPADPIQPADPTRRF
ncbi:hypothetical protein BGX26_005654 [Mortierella sp. AD094]|nr:hypothetical protein BGX26_005654 [Mortierella sp. AD094]